MKGRDNKDISIGVYICHCGTNIAATVDVAEVTRFANSLPGVVVARDYMYMCSDPGQELIKNDIRNNKLDRVVVASCSPRMHEPTFRKACEDAGLNPYCMEMANIREHCSWVHTDKDKATAKAKELVASAVSKASLLQPLEPIRTGVIPACVVIGGGIAGIQAALDIADAGFTVYLVEREPSIGGHMAQLDKTFPTLDCSACVLTPKMVDVARHKNIRLITYAELESVEGYVGNFRVRVRKKPRYVDEDKCTGCGECAKVCPVKELVPNDFDLGLSKRGALYIPFPQAVPLVYTIDKIEGTPPCRLNCPAGVNVQGYVALISQGRYKEAVDLIRERNPLPAVCGYVCTHPCESACNRAAIDEPVAIMALKRFATDMIDYDDVEVIEPEEREGKIAIIGSGPAGLTAAYYLVKAGYNVHIFEKLSVPGGMLAAGIPHYRLPRSVLWKDIEYIRRVCGDRLEIETGVEIDKSMFERIRAEYDAVCISVGADRSRKLGIEGEELKGVVHGVEFLRELNLRLDRVVDLSLSQIKDELGIGQRVAVIGGGDVAVDAARCALRLGSTVTIVYRRTREEMPARETELQEAEEEGVQYLYLASPSRIIGNERVEALECIRMELGEPDESGRRRPVPVEGSEFTLDVDTVIVAIGQQSGLEFLEGSGIATDRGGLKADYYGHTGVEGIFACGDTVTGPATVIDAIAGGRRVAEAIDRYLKGLPECEAAKREEKEIGIEAVKERLKDAFPTVVEERKEPEKLPPEARTRSFDVVELGFNTEDAIEEANRCLRCGICADCRLCERVCDADAIMHDMNEELVEIDVGAIVIATGYDLFNPSLEPDYGYEYEEVITSLEFERLCSASGPTAGKIEIKGKEPKEVVFISCVGSREKEVEREMMRDTSSIPKPQQPTKGNEYCSRVCCMYIAKQAHLVKEHIPDANVTVFYTDVRAFGKGFEEFYWRVKEEGVKYIRRELTDEIRVKKDEKGKLRVKTVSEGRYVEKDADLVVLATGIVPRRDVLELAKKLKITQSADRFFMEAHPKLRPVDTLTDGIFLAGCAQSPKDIPDSVAQASAAASRACDILASEYVEVEPIVVEVDEAVCIGCGACEAVCPFGAIELKEEEKHLEELVLVTRKSYVNPALCKGCGACVAECPVGAISQKHFTSAQIGAMVRVLGCEPASR